MDSLSVFGAPRGSSISAPRPLKMYLPQGAIKSAWKASEVPYAGVRSRRSGAQKAGLAYQKRVGSFLPSRNNQWVVVASPWYAYIDGSCERRYCQPDYLLLDEHNKTCTIVEVKIRWTSDAWWQLTHLYIPVLQRVRADLSLLRLCVCRSYDPYIPLEEEVNLCDDLLDIKPSAFNVLVVR